jgi:hypothetical protein
VIKINAQSVASDYHFFRMKKEKYLILLVDREHARFYLISNGHFIEEKELEKDHVPQKVKHGDDTWDAQDKIFRHIEVHLHKHLQRVVEEAANFIKGKNVTGVLIGGHKPLFTKVTHHLPTQLSKKVIGTFVTELKINKEMILKNAQKEIDKIETLNEENKLQQALQ